MKDFIMILNHELRKIWINKKFLILLLSVLLINLFVLWYSTLSNGYIPSLASYKGIYKDMDALSEKEKIKYLENYSISINEDGNFLYTDNYEKEKSLLDYVVNEVKTVMNYDEFLKSVNEQGNSVSNVSIFNSSSGNEFSDKNIEKTIRDYIKMDGLNPGFEAGKGIDLATEFPITDVLIILIICVIVYILIFYEKERNLFSIIRVSKNGGMTSGLSKVLALQISCIIIAILFYGENLIYAFVNLPIPDFGREIQSLAIFGASTLKISIGFYLILYILAKAAIFIIIGSIIMVISIISSYVFIQYIGIGAILLISYSFWTNIMATSSLSLLKYLNIVGLLDINRVFGEYNNLNFFNTPINYWILWVCFTIILLIVLSSVSVILFCKIKNTSVNTIRFNFRPFSPHNSLLRHEAYKILIMKKGLVMILVFMATTSLFYSNHDYYLSGSELKYKQYMKKIEGPLTEDTETFLKKEKEKYEDAIKKSDEIDELYKSNKITMLESMKLKEGYIDKLNSYPIFNDVWEKYEFIKENRNAEFVYDSAYKMLFNKNDTMLKLSILLYFVIMIFLMSVVFPMEDGNSQYMIMHPTFIGVKKIEKSKVLISSFLSVLITLIAVGGRVIHISRYYEFSNIGAKALSIYGDFWGGKIKIILLLILFIVGLVLFSLVFMKIIFIISKRVKNSLYTVVISIILISICNFIFL